MYSNNNQEYTGYYWKTSSGKIYTGKTPQDSNILELIPLQNTPNGDIDKDSSITAALGYNVDPNVFPTPDSTYLEYIHSEYLTLKNINSNTGTMLPHYLPTLPTDKDYQTGEFRRYFCKKINETIYIEINKDQFDLLKNKDAKIAYEYYQPFYIPWALTGDKTYVNNVNYNMVQLVMYRQKLPMFNIYIKDDYLKYYK